MIYYSDINGDLILDNTGDIKKETNESSVTNSIQNILFTRKGSRRMLPEFGSNLNLYVFEPLDEITARDIGEEILESVLK
jgi:phage baseplate assembly protein W